jgi:hypothetical protein
MLNQFADNISNSWLDICIIVFEQINNLSNSTPDGIMECGYQQASDLSDSIVSTITYNAQPVCW